MRNPTKVKDVMVPIQNFDIVDISDKVGEVLNRFYKLENIGVDNTYVLDRIVFVVDESKRIKGKISGYQFLRGLVPDFSQQVVRIRRGLRQMHLSTAQFLERCTWMSKELIDLVEQETYMRIEEIMSPAQPSIKEDDNINLAIYKMLNERKQQLLVEQNGEVVGVISLTNVFSAFLKIAKQRGLLIDRLRSPLHQKSWAQEDEKNVIDGIVPLGGDPGPAYSI